ncbi:MULTISPECIES: hypothetical protein [Mameliella]|uniref:hypothetical protein n=1 Tax=Mameliella TaxID=1434019 RepID=UPI000B533CFB|nr:MULTISPECIES: hypothetical protein [Mameliella]MCR9276151.1 hypothetical protein [Paracoccaceae bacterium]OWV62959.1 hypothetical protein CDZ98_01960 [Mameliella alba]
MIRAAAIILILAAPATGAQTIVEGGPEWLDKRAEVFSSVCMAAAPDFAAFDAKAEAAGLERIEQGWHLPPEAFLSLRAHDGFCSCFMTVGAPDQTEMVGAIFGRLMQDWGASFTGKAEGLANVAPFQRDGIEAVSILEPRTLDGQKWLSARITVFGACPEGEGGQ